MQEKKITPKELGIPESIPLPKRKDWRIGMIGFGGIARSHTKAYQTAGWNIVAVADPDPAARERAKEITGAKRIYEDYPDLIRDEEVEIISLLTHPTLREPVVKLAAEAGKPIQTEKPLGPNMDECERMVKIAEDAGIPFAVSQNRRWSPANFFAYHIIQKGLIGKPFYAFIEIHGTQDVRLAQHAFYSVCTDFLTIQWNNHLADLLRYWTGQDAKRVLARTGRMEGQNFVSDNLFTSLADFGDGLTGQIIHSELLRSSLRSQRCRVDGDEGSVVFDLDGATVQFESKQLGEGAYVLETGGAEFAVSMCGPMGDFLISIEEGCEPMVSARRNLATMRHIIAEEKSVRAGGMWVEV
ncbi:MAG: Gfo/Idh/MocA family oxidoreductase [Planctomycetota bacterium]